MNLGPGSARIEPLAMGFQYRLFADGFGKTRFAEGQ